MRKQNCKICCKCEAKFRCVNFEKCRLNTNECCQCDECFIKQHGEGIISKDCGNVWTDKKVKVIYT